MSAAVHHGAKKSTRRQRALRSQDRSESEPCVAFVGFVRGSPSLDRSHVFSAFSWIGGDHVDCHDFAAGLAPSCPVAAKSGFVVNAAAFGQIFRPSVGFGRLMPAGDMAGCVYDARRRVGRDNCLSVSCTLSRRISLRACMRLSCVRPGKLAECVAELWNLIP